ncbi:1,4-dihydroxy-2-naphthoate polyprenyltransferase [Kibdelosporangium phytohabitans]|uniref:1,4-dihydroxy-2-naphthoate octaprenyltransferase n=1 Tax=Kibdelosporangium phytohabitans TaxID=860235 RepID=A0A0N9IFE4_9PSEU|nr:1,4-dihydroxy-2-naphthoate polyprenyltransferase [Kibdelosporangium phytohabitans]ALG13993.1 1,4-dihydroxy-2-naphthoate octaprenyltransferase [Kibdelosporangium phytohabitans]MBE1467054.1 1,4-dihydroxy-2-naphthoate octaprenyltransferase [Kibdelosporangium phytohabitans]
MATVAQWMAGARVRTLPNSIAPVLVGSGATVEIGGFVWWKAVLALIVALAFQVGVNYANDYSDGIRGTDAERVGPLRLVGSGLVPPAKVRTAAFACFAIACVAGLVLVVTSGQWWLLAVGVVCLLGAWYYTGGKNPYGYLGLGEVAVFLFFGPVAVLGTLYVQAGRITWLAVITSVALGCFSAAVLAANNLRDLPGDSEAGKRTMAVRLGDSGTRNFYSLLALVPFVVTFVLAFTVSPWFLLGVAAGLQISPSVRTVYSGATGPSLIPVLKDTALAMLVWAVATTVAFVIS